MPMIDGSPGSCKKRKDSSLDALVGLSNLLASLSHTGKRRVVLGHTLNTQTLIKTDEQKVLSKFKILSWATFTAILGLGWTPVQGEHSCCHLDLTQ